MAFPGYPDTFDLGSWREEITTPPVFTLSGTLSNGSNTVAVTSFTYTPIVGQQITESTLSGIPGNSTVSAIGVSSITMSANATANGATTLTIGCEPVTVAQAKKFARIEYNDDDTDLIPDLITGARQYAEGPELKRAIMLQGRTLYLMGFPWGGGYYNRFIRSQGPSPWWIPSSQGLIRMAYPPFQGLISVTYIDQSSGNVDTIPLSQITQSVTPATPGTIMPVYGAVWPIPRPQVDAVRIQFACGYGAFPSQVPTALLIGLRGMIAATYENREEFLDTRQMSVNQAVERSLQTERWGTYN